MPDHAAGLDRLMRMFEATQARVEPKDKKEDEEEIKKISKPDFERSGQKIVVPENMEYDEAAAHLLRIHKEMGESIKFSEDVVAYPVDVALAVKHVLEELFGHTYHQGKWGEVARMISVPDSPTTKVSVPWGEFTIPTWEAVFDLTAKPADGGVWRVNINVKCTRRHENLVREVVAQVVARARSHSIYRGKAIRVEFGDEGMFGFGPPPPPEFLEVTTDRSQLIFNRSLEASLDANLFTLITNTERASHIGVPLKRGILLAGTYGTGKSMTAVATAKVATDHGWTFVYSETPGDLPQLLQYVRMWEPVVVFMEDIDRVTEDRNDFSNEILNTIDGIDSKEAKVIVVLTTNHPEKIHKAMLRPGRLDSIIRVEPPDAEAVERLILHYGHNVFEENIQLGLVGAALAGNIPATIREVVERSKLYMISEGREEVTSDDLLAASDDMQGQLELLNKETKRDPDVVERLGYAIGDRLGMALRQDPYGGTELRTRLIASGHDAVKAKMNHENE